MTVPHYLNPVELSDGGVTIVALESIFKKTQLGPFEAKKTMHDIDRDDLFVLKVIHIYIYICGYGNLLFFLSFPFLIYHVF